MGDARGERWVILGPYAQRRAGEILVLDNAAGVAGDLVIGHDVMEDAIRGGGASRAGVGGLGRTGWGSSRRRRPSRRAGSAAAGTR